LSTQSLLLLSFCLLLNTMSDPSAVTAQRQCPHCNRMIPQQNWELHESRCRQQRQREQQQQEEPQAAGLIPARLRVWWLRFFGIVMLCILFFRNHIMSWIRSSPTANEEFRYDGNDDPAKLFGATRFEAVIRAARERKDYMRRHFPQSYPLDSWSDSYLDWTIVGKDDFWKRSLWAWEHLRRRPGSPDDEDAVEETSMIDHFVSITNAGHEQRQIAAIQLRDTYLAFVDKVKNLEWTPDPPSKGLCQQQVDGTVCAVYRWNVWKTESDNHAGDARTLSGRLQCWTDPSLTRFDPTFVLRHPQFHRSLHQSAGCMCLADIDGFVVQIGAPEGVPVLWVNNFIIPVEATFSFEIEIDDSIDGPVEVAEKLQMYLFPFLDSYIDNPTRSEEL